VYFLHSKTFEQLQIDETFSIKFSHSTSWYFLGFTFSTNWYRNVHFISSCLKLFNQKFHQKFHHKLIQVNGCSMQILWFSQ